MSPGIIKNTSSKPYLRIAADRLVKAVDKGTEGAEERAWKSPDGKTGIAYEIVYQSWSGKILSVTTKDGKFGEECQIEFEDAVINLSTKSQYFQDFASKIHNGNLSEPFKFHPYSIEKEDGGFKKGISLQQNDIKLQNYFYNFEEKKNLHGFPVADEEKKKKMKKAYWPIFFAEVAMFLVDQLKLLEFPEAKQVEADPASFESDADAMVAPDDDGQNDEFIKNL